MNTSALIIGLLYGVVTAGVCYVVSLVTAGLFGRTFYKLYARILIGICSVMLIAPGLQLIAIHNEFFATFGLCLSQYTVMAVLGYGVIRFNREHLKKSVTERPTLAYFTFGTLAYAAMITLGFLHLAIATRPGLIETQSQHIPPSHYGPLLVMLAALVLHTDYNLKQSVGDVRRFSHFTFIGYAISFAGVALAAMPYLGNTLSILGITDTDRPFLLNFFSGQTLLLAIFLYGWLVYRYESIPPLFLLLLAIVGEYHVLITQWSIQSLGPASWGIACLPLAALLAFLDYYFATWDERKQKAIARTASAEQPAGNTLRFAIPFRVIAIGFAVSLFCITLWTRFKAPGYNSSYWLVANFGIYSLFVAAIAIARKTPSLIYVSGILLALAVTLGHEPLDPVRSLAILGALGALLSILTFASEKVGLKTLWRTPLADCGLLFASLALIGVVARNYLGMPSIHSSVQDVFDVVALIGVAISFTVSGYLYRSSLPVYGTLVALTAINPIFSAPLSLLTVLTNQYLQQKLTKEHSAALQYRIQLFGSIPLPFAATLPDLFIRPLFIGALPLAVAGLAIQTTYILNGNLSPLVLFGSFTVAAALTLETRIFRQPWIYVLAIASIFLTVHTVAHQCLFAGWARTEIWSAHLLLVAILSVIGWVAARIYAAWCDALLLRIAEDQEAALSSKRAFYVDWMRYTLLVTSILTLAQVTYACFFIHEPSFILLIASIFLFLLFALAAKDLRSPALSYISLFAITLGGLQLFTDLFPGQLPHSPVLAGLGLFAAVIAFVISQLGPRDKSLTASTGNPWHPFWRSIDGKVTDIWGNPLAVYAILSSGIAVTMTSSSWIDYWKIGSTLPNIPYEFAMASCALLLSTKLLRLPVIYLTAIALGFMTCHLSLVIVISEQTKVLTTTLLHLVLASLLSLACCGIAMVIARVFNAIPPSSDPDNCKSLALKKEFYAGLLLDFVIAIGVFALLNLGIIVFGNQLSSFNEVRLHTIASVLLIIVFCLAGTIYRSQVLTYFALAAISLSIHTLIQLNVSETNRLSFQITLVSGVACLSGLLAWIASRRLTHTEPSSPRIFQKYGIWTQPPLPLVSMDAYLWLRPLARNTEFLSILGLVLLGFKFLNVQPESQIVLLDCLPMFLSALAMLTVTKSFKILRSSDAIDQADAQTLPSMSEWLERGFFYLSSLITLVIAIHSAIHLQYFSRFDLQSLIDLHTLLATCLATAGWSIATLYKYPFRRISSSLPDYHRLNSELHLYGNLLYHVSLCIGFVALSASTVALFLPAYHSTYLLSSLVLLAIFFCLTSSTYRNNSLSYIALLILGLAALHTSSIPSLPLPDYSSTAIPTFAVLGLGLFLLDAITKKESLLGHFLQTSLSELPYPWQQQNQVPKQNEKSTSTISPLCHVALAYTVLTFVTLAIVTFNPNSLPWMEIPASLHWVSIASLVVSFTIAAWFYQAPLFTYSAAMAVVFGTMPNSLLFDKPLEGLAVRWIVASLIFWLVSFALEKYSSWRTTDKTSSLSTNSLLRIYERPMVRSSSFLAVIATLSCFFIWQSYGWLPSRNVMLFTWSMGVALLLLNAGSFAIMKSDTQTQLLVYSANVLLALGWMVLCYLNFGIDYVATSLGLVALAQASLGCLLVKLSERANNPELTISATLRNFGYPFTYSAFALSLLASTLAGYLVSSIVSVDDLLQGIWTWSTFNSSFYISQASALLIAAVTSLILIRVLRYVFLVYQTIACSFVGSMVLLGFQFGETLGSMVFASLLLCNALLLVANWIRTHHASVAKLLNFPVDQCEKPFYNSAFLASSMTMIVHSMLLVIVLIKSPFTAETFPTLWCIPLVLAFYTQLIYLHPNRFHVNLLVIASIYGLSIYTLSGQSMISTDIALAVLAIAWGAIAATITLPIGGKLLNSLKLPSDQELRNRGERSLRNWATAILLFALPMSFLLQQTNHPTTPNLSITLLLATVASLLYSFRWRVVAASTLSALMLPATIASVVFDFGEYQTLFAFTSLILSTSALLNLAMGWIAVRYSQKSSEKTFLQGVGDSLTNSCYPLGISALVFSVTYILQYEVIFPVALSILLVSLCCLWLAVVSAKEHLAYLSLSGFLFSLLFIVHNLASIAITNSPFMTLLVLAYCFGLYAINLFVNRSASQRIKVLNRPTYYLALALPSILLLTIPYNQRAYAALELLAAAAFYMLIARQSQIRAANYIAAALTNLAIYLWLPVASEFTGLYQLYVIPAAITVLIFAQLHRHDLKPKVLTSIRMAASGAILAVSTYELLLNKDPSLLDFLMILILSLGGIACGIALRVKPFIYIGIAFLMINVSGQIILQFQREGGVVRAIILIVVGLVVLATMIFFNIHRERILKNYRSFQMKWE